MSVKITKRGQLVGGLVAIGALGFVGYKYVQGHPEQFARMSGQASTEIKGINLPNANVGRTEAPATIKPAFPVAQVRQESAGTIRMKSIAWNGQIGTIYANGGARTQRGSIMDQYGVNLEFERQDDMARLASELVNFAEAYKRGERDPSVGSHAIVIMGDAVPGFMAGLQSQLPDGFHAVVIGAPGRSFGEDKCMGPPEWADDPQKAKGKVVAAVLRDGDIHVCYVWAQNNGIKINPDPRTYDPEALNIHATGTFAEADQAYMSGLCETRPVVRDGKTTGKSQRVCVEATATWTPGDVNVVQNKGGVVSLLSTRETGTQMFSTIIVIKEWARENPATVTNLLKASLDGATQVANDRAKLRQAACASAQVWKEQDCDYWEKYYYGRMEDSPGTGRQVRLGGSQALGLASNLQYFLPDQSGMSIYGRVYTMFGDADRRMYPADMPSFPPAAGVVDTFFLEKIRDASGPVGAGAVFGTFTGSENTQVAARSYSIQFEQGSARILPSSTKDLQAILDNATVASGLALEINGYTSSEGEDALNQSLSEARARAVREWLAARAGSGLVNNQRVRVNGYGESNLILDASGRENQVASRRVEIRLLSE